MSNHMLGIRISKTEERPKAQNVSGKRQGQGAEGERQNRQRWQTRASLLATPVRGQAFTRLQLGGSPGEPAFIFMAWGASGVVTVLSGFAH